MPSREGWIHRGFRTVGKPRSRFKSGRMIGKNRPALTCRPLRPAQSQRECRSWGVGLRRGAKRSHPRDGGFDQGIRRLRRRAIGQFARRPRQHSCLDRAERRRQDHLLQPPHQVPGADARPHRVRRPRHHGGEARRRGAPRPRPLVPDFGRVPAFDRFGECAHRAAAPPRQLVRLLALEAGAARS